MLEDAEMTWADIEAVVIGTAPDIFEGVMMPELYLADVLGAAGKPIMRVHTAGSVGGSTAVVATHLIESQVHTRVLTLAFEKQSEGDTNFAFSSGRSGGVGAAAGHLGAAHRRLHRAFGSAGLRGSDGGREGPQERGRRTRTCTCRSPTSASRW